MTDAYNKITAILRGKDFGVEGEIAGATVLRNLPHWDSLKTLMFLMAVEKEFSIEIKPEDIVSLITVDDVAKKTGN